MTSRRTHDSPDHSFTAAELINQERKQRGFLRRTMSLKSFGPEAEGQSSQLRLFTVSLHVYLQDLRHIVSVDTYISHMVPQNGLILVEIEFVGKNGFMSVRSW